MKIIIVGCGKVGVSLAERLSAEGHDLVMVDMNPQKVEHLSNQFDALGIVGNGASFNIQQEAGVESADLFIAVTGEDELNLLCCLMAKKTGHCDTIARLLACQRAGHPAHLRTGEPLHVNLEKLRRSGYLLQAFALFVNLHGTPAPAGAGGDPLSTQSMAVLLNTRGSSRCLPSASAWRKMAAVSGSSGMAAKASTVPAAAQQGRGKSTAAMPRPTACISRAARRVLACARASRFVILHTTFRAIIPYLPST